MKSQRPHVARKGLLTIAVTFVGPLFALSMLHYFEPLLLLTPRSVLRLAYHSDPTPQFPNLALAVDGAASLPSYRAILSTVQTRLASHSDLDDLRAEDISECQGQGSPLQASADPHRRWCFKGSRGQVGIMLSAPSRVAHISITHPSVLSTLPSAPRNILVWGVVDGEANQSTFEESIDVLQSLKAQLPVKSPFSRHGSQEPVYVPLANIVYNVQDKNTVQIFDVFPEIHKLNMDFGIVVIQIISNWGESYTALHHVGVYGEKVVVV